MCLTVKAKRKINVKEIELRISNVSWEDSIVNDEYDDAFEPKIPCFDKQDRTWKPIIDLETGRIENWEKGVTAEINYKVVDSGKYFLVLENGKKVPFNEDGYVPIFLALEDVGYGDYIIINVNEEGFINKWRTSSVLSTIADELFEEHAFDGE